MKSLSSLGIALSLTVGCLLLVLLAEICYFLWWKKRSINNGEIEVEEGFKKSARELFNKIFCWNKPQSLNTTRAMMNPMEQDPQLQTNATSSKHFLLSPFFENSNVETDLIALHNISAPPRFLFTIKEETKEDLESEDGKSRGGGNKKSLRDLLLTVETPFLTPLSSPPFFTPPVTPLNSYNPLFESSSDQVEVLVMMNSLKSSTPSPKFKFLKDAEEKLYRRKLMEEAEKRVHETSSASVNSNGIETVVSSSPSKGGQNLGNGSSSPSTIRSANSPMLH